MRRGDCYGRITGRRGKYDRHLGGAHDALEETGTRQRGVTIVIKVFMCTTK
jgi:hypothetical protein